MLNTENFILKQEKGRIVIMKPLIGIVSLYDENKESYWMLPGYPQALEEAGAASVILPLTEEKEALFRFASLCDGFFSPAAMIWSPPCTALKAPGGAG